VRPCDRGLDPLPGSTVTPTHSAAKRVADSESADVNIIPSLSHVRLPLELPYGNNALRQSGCLRIQPGNPGHRRNRRVAR
jgi:hypothetical protein